MEWKWSITNKENYEKSPRYNTTEIVSQTASQQVSLNTDSNAFHQSLLSENDVWSIDEPINVEPKYSSMELNKRENVYNKMSEREIIGQRGMNPFMPNKTYVNDVAIQDNFLKPVSTSDDREKSSSSSSNV